MPRDKEATREAIITTALRMFGEHGYGGVRVEDIARAAGVSRATFYNHFTDREDVLAALYERLLRSDDGIDVEAADDGTGPLAQIRVTMRDAAQRMLANDELARLVYRLPIHQEAILRPTHAGTPAVFRRIHTLLDQAVTRGEVRDDVPVDLLCAHVHSALETTMRAWASGATTDPLDRLDVLVDLALGGIVTPGGPPPARRGSRPRRPSRRRAP